MTAVDSVTSSRRIGSIRLDDTTGLAADLEAAERSGYLDSYTEFVCGSWRTCVLWNATGDGSDVLIRDYAGAAQPTEHGRRLAAVGSLIESHFDVTNLRFARLTRLAPGTVVVPHRDYVELERDLVRVHVPLLTNAAAFASEEETIYRMAQGEVWFLDATRPHSIANFSSTPRVHLLLDFAADDADVLLASVGPPSFPATAIVPRRPLRPGERDSLLALAGVADTWNLKDVLAILIKRYFVAELAVEGIFESLFEIAQATSDDALILEAEWYKRLALTRR